MLHGDNSTEWLPGMAARWGVAFAHLLQAEKYAIDTEQPRLQFAVEIDDLLAAGLTANDLRWLSAKGYVEIAAEISKSRFHQPRRFGLPNSLSARQCAILTDAGLLLAEQICGAPSDEAHAGPSRRPSSSNVPRWDAAGRILWFGSHLIKRFTVPAANQEIVLGAFDEQGWPVCIDDPLPPKDEIDTKRRLHNTIKRLNQSHECRLIRFAGSGTGLGVRWEQVDSTSQSAPTSATDRA